MTRKFTQEYDLPLIRGACKLNSKIGTAYPPSKLNGGHSSREGLRPRLHAYAYDAKHDSSVFVTLLRTCIKNKDLSRGTRLHDAILKRGLLGMCSDALVCLYAKCGALSQASELFDIHHSKDVFTWTALIAGYAHNGQDQGALNYFDQMQHLGLSPNAVTFACALKACGNMRAVDKGEEIHNEIAKQGLLDNNIKLGTALVCMYAKCGALAKAQQVMEELLVRDVISWNALITGYAEHGEGEKALKCFQQMQHEGLSPDAVTFACMLKACGSIRAVGEGGKIHNEIAKQGLLQNDIVLGNALVDMYAKCGAFAKARRVLKELPVRDAISWNALISGYTEHGQGEQALNCFEYMQRQGLSPDVVTFSCILKACGSIGAAHRGQEIHDEIAKHGLMENNVILGSALVDMYAKCGVLTKAQQVLEELPVRNVISWNALIAGYLKQDKSEQALNCFEQMQREGLSPDAVTFAYILRACGSIRASYMGEKVHNVIVKQGLLGNDIVLGTALVDMYAKCGALLKARQVLEDLSFRDVISWNALVAGYTEHGEGAQALNCFEQMQHEGLSPSAETFACMLQACSSIGAAGEGENIHHEIFKQGLLGNDVVLGTAVVDMYMKCGALEKAQGVFEELPIRDVIAWNALIAGLILQGKDAKALRYFEQMQREGLLPDAVTFACVLKACGSIGAAGKGKNIHDEIIKQGLLRNNVVLGTALVDMYAKCGALKKARQVLKELPVRDVISWNALIARYAEHGEGKQALNCFEQMHNDGLFPNVVTFACILKACGSIGAAGKGETIHDEIAKQGLLRNNVRLGTALVDMYAKCGDLGKARQVLEDLPFRDVISWNALIAGLIQHGEGMNALSCFEQMQREGLSPNAATFTCMLSACSRLGLVKSAQRCFAIMSTKYDVQPDLEQYTCMVDVFGRAGQLDKAVGVIEKIPSSDRGVWSALLGACQKWGDVNVGRWAFEHAVQINKSNATVYVLMANMYAAAGMHKDAKKIKAIRNDNRAWTKSSLS